MTERIRVILVDDHPVVLQGLQAFLENQPDFEVVGMAVNGQDALKLLKEGLTADVILADMDMPVMNGAQLTQVLKTMEYPGKVLMLTMHDDERYIVQALEAGAAGFLYKHSGMDELVYALRHTHEHGVFICHALSEKLIKTFLNKVKTTVPANCIDFSERELEILTLICEGYTNQEIADRIFSSRRTVEGHRLTLIEKAGVRNTATLVRYAVTNGLVQ